MENVEGEWGAKGAKERREVEEGGRRESKREREKLRGGEFFFILRCDRRGQNIACSIHVLQNS